MIDLTLTEEQQGLVDVARDAATKEFPRTALVQAAVTGDPVSFDAASWTRLAELGLLGLGAPERLGGLGLGLAEEVLVLLELGQVPAPGPFIGTMLATQIAVAAGADELAAAFVDGSAQAGVITGDHLLDAGLGEYGVRVDSDGGAIVRVDAQAVTPVDQAASLARVLTSEPVVTVRDPRLQARLRLLTAAYLIGLADAATEMSADYAKTREQFGKPIGTFQAVKHRCAEMAIRAYAARAELLVAALLLDTAETTSGTAGVLEATSAYLLALQAARGNVEDNVQNHGGIGITAEHDAGVLVKRMHSYTNAAGSPADLVGVLLTASRTPFG
jgi:alkylation response protein AidB-like acyl-CoA dehydrogenase